MRVPLRNRKRKREKSKKLPFHEAQKSNTFGNVDTENGAGCDAGANCDDLFVLLVNDPGLSTKLD